MREAKARMDKTIKTDLPRIIGTTCVKVVQDNFRLQGYDSGNGVTKWAPRKNSTNKKYNSRSGVKGSTASSKNKILVQTGNLRESVKYVANGQTVRVGIDLGVIPYAQVHNEGGVITAKERDVVLHFRGISQNVKTLKLRGVFASLKAKRRRDQPTYAQKRRVYAHSWRMPKRQFMPTEQQGPNPKMVKAIQGKLKSEIDADMRVFKK